MEEVPSTSTPRIGVSAVAADPTSWATWCQRLEAAGMDEISVADHLVAGCMPPMAALAAAAAATERIGLSTMVLNNELRHPAVLANEAAFVAELSGGRLVLGIGAGHAVEEHRAIGLPFPSPHERVERLEESVSVLRRLLAGESVTTSGPAYPLRQHAAAPRTAHDVPLLVGGGSRAVLGVAARHADIVGLTGFSHIGGQVRLTHFGSAQLGDRIRDLREMAGARAAELRLQALVQLVRVSDDRERAAMEVLAAWQEPSLTVEALLDSPFIYIGSPDEIAEQMSSRSERFGIETWTVFSGRPVDPSLQELAHVIQALRG